MPHRRLKDIVAGQALVHVSPDTSVAETVARMQKQHVGCALVLDGDTLQGIFTGSNLVQRVLDEGLDPKATAVGTVMTAEPFCLECDREGIESVRAMRERQIRHVVVTNVGEKGYGIVSIHDFPTEEIGEFEEELAFEERLWEEL